MAHERGDDTDSGRVLIVEDHSLLADSLVLALRSEGLNAETFEPVDAEQIVKAAVRYRPTVVLLDLELGGDIGDAIPLIGPLHELGALVVVLTGVSDRVRLAQCLEAGADGLLSKSLSFEQLIGAISDLTALGTLISPAQRDDLLGELRRQRAEARARRAPFERLTPRERAVLASLVQGKAAETIAKEFFVSLATVRSQIRSVLMKLGVNSQLAAVALAREHGWDVNEQEP